MFWLRNKKIKFSLRTLNLSPDHVSANSALLRAKLSNAIFCKFPDVIRLIFNEMPLFLFTSV